MLMLFVAASTSFAAPFNGKAEGSNDVNLTAEQVSQILAEHPNDNILIDVRNGSEYDEKSIPNAIMINKDKLVDNFDAYKGLIGNRTIIVHCKAGVRGLNTAKAIAPLTQNKVYNLEGGIEGWQGAGFRVISSGVSIMRQVQMAAGSIIIIFTLLGFFVDRRFLFVSLFVGCGLLFAGVTGFCGLAVFFKMMPWNQA